MAGQQFRIQGVREVDRVLKLMPREIAEKALVAALRKGAKIIRDEAETRAPVATGRLKENIRVRKARGRGASATVTIGPTRKVAHIGMFAEFGTATQAARPWLRPAFDQTAPAALVKFVNEIGKTVERAAVRLAGSFAKSGLAGPRRRRRRR